MLLGHMISTNLNFRAKRDRLSVFCREVKKKKKIQRAKWCNKVT